MKEWICSSGRLGARGKRKNAQRGVDSKKTDKKKRGTGGESIKKDIPLPGSFDLHPRLAGREGFRGTKSRFSFLDFSVWGGPELGYKT